MDSLGTGRVCQLLLMLVGLWLGPSCNSERKESKECMQAREHTRELALHGSLEDAQAELERSRALCGPASSYDIERLTRMIERRQVLERERERQEKLQELRDTESPLRPFLRWAKSLGESNDKSVGKVTCEPRGSDQFGFCTSTVEQEGRVFRLRYHRDDPRVFRFEYELPLSVSCQDFLQPRPSSRFEARGVNYELCELTEHGLSGMWGLIALQAPGSRVWLFSERYRARDAELQRLISRR